MNSCSMVSTMLRVIVDDASFDLNNLFGLCYEPSFFVGRPTSKRLTNAVARFTMCHLLNICPH